MTCRAHWQQPLHCEGAQAVSAAHIKMENYFRRILETNFQDFFFSISNFVRIALKDMKVKTPLCLNDVAQIGWSQIQKVLRTSITCFGGSPITCTHFIVQFRRLIGSVWANINAIPLTDIFCLLFRYNGASNIWLQ